MSEKIFAAHSPNTPNQPWHLLKDHLKQTGALAYKFAGSFGAGPLAQCAGILHDLGKYNLDFQRRIRGETIKVEHALAGAWAVETAVKVVSQSPLTQNLSPADRIFSRLIGYAIAGHHAGLPDWRQLSNEGGGRLKERLENFQPSLLDPVWETEINIQLKGLIPQGFKFGKKTWHGFEFAFLTRMIFSCLVDSDFKDTEHYYATLEGRIPPRDWPSLSMLLPQALTALNERMDAFRTIQKTQNFVEDERARVHNHVRSFASLPKGVFSLTVPTGGGKTLTSLGFALDHAAHHDLRRIIYAIPFTSIIEQTAKTFRSVLGSEVGQHILEHHSAIELNNFPADHALEARSKLNLAMEDWAAPLIVTTTVQLFESLFAARPSRCRKLHNIARSIIIIDEVQSLPWGLMGPCIQALDNLARNYECSVVLCTATQPINQLHLNTDTQENNPLRIQSQVTELAPNPSALVQNFKRVVVRLAGMCDDASLVETLKGSPQALVIVNSRTHARELFQALKEAHLEGVTHLSTRQHATDRQTILEEVGHHLQNNEPCRLIATSLIEAGVDLDFPTVWRAEAGLANIAQAAGRCNRHGKRPPEDSIVTVFTPKDQPANIEMKRFAEDFRRIEHIFKDDLLSLEAVEGYFREVTWRLGAQGVDENEILSLFTLDHNTMLEGQFRTCAERFKMIKDRNLPIIIPSTEIEQVLTDLDQRKIWPSQAARELQRFIVQISPKDREALIQNGAAHYIKPDFYGDQFLLLTRTALYNRDIGLEWERSNTMDIIL